MQQLVEASEAIRYHLLEPRLTSPRLAPYLRAASGNHRDAIRLYEWNIRLSGAVYTALHVVEVVLRNAIDAELCAWNRTQVSNASGGTHRSDWLLDPAPLLRRIVRAEDLAKARTRAARAIRHQQREVLHADLLTQMTFGTWRYMLPSRDPGRQYLWDQSLRGAFPHLDRSPRDLVRWIDGIYQLRNRVAHLEPLLRSGNVRAQFGNMRHTLCAIDPVTETWFVSKQTITATLRARRGKGGAA
jgi:hypothetical protein